MFNDFSTGQKGNVGLGMAIAYFSKLGSTVALPLTDTQAYDLIVDMNGELKKVQVKFTTRTIPNGNYYVDMRLRGHVNAEGKYYQKEMDKTQIDYVYICTAAFSEYLFPANAITSQTMALGDKWKDYKIS